MWSHWQAGSRIARTVRASSNVAQDHHGLGEPLLQPSAPRRRSSRDGEAEGDDDVAPSRRTSHHSPRSSADHQAAAKDWVVDIEIPPFEGFFEYSDAMKVYRGGGGPGDVQIVQYKHEVVARNAFMRGRFLRATSFGDRKMWEQFCILNAVAVATTALVYASLSHYRDLGDNEDEPLHLVDLTQITNMSATVQTIVSFLVGSVSAFILERWWKCRHDTISALWQSIDDLCFYCSLFFPGNGSHGQSPAGDDELNHNVRRRYKSFGEGEEAWKENGADDEDDEPRSPRFYATIGKPPPPPPKTPESNNHHGTVMDDVAVKTTVLRYGLLAMECLVFECNQVEAWRIVSSSPESQAHLHDESNMVRWGGSRRPPRDPATGGDLPNPSPRSTTYRWPWPWTPRQRGDDLEQSGRSIDDVRESEMRARADRQVRHLRANGLLVNDEEEALLSRVPVRCRSQVVWTWMASFIMRLCLDGRLPAPKDNYSKLTGLCSLGRNACRGLISQLEAPIHFALFHQMSLMVQIYLVLIAVTTGICSGLSLLMLEKFEYIPVQFITLWLNAIFMQGLMQTQSSACNPFRENDMNSFPLHVYMNRLREQCSCYYDAAAEPPGVAKPLINVGGPPRLPPESLSAQVTSGVLSKERGGSTVAAYHH